MRFWIVLLLAMSGTAVLEAGPVRLVREGEGWRVLAGGKPFRILGVGVGLKKGLAGEDFLQQAAALGATAVRTWGVDQGTKEYLDRANALGLMVAAGIWLDWVTPGAGVSYIGDTPTKRKLRSQALAYVQRFKDHPAILCWGLGNEVFAFSKDNEPERKAFALFLNELAREIKRLDPDRAVPVREPDHRADAYRRPLHTFRRELGVVRLDADCRASVLLRNFASVDQLFVGERLLQQRVVDHPCYLRNCD